IVTALGTPAFGVNATSPAPIVSARKNGPVALNNTNMTLVSIKLPAGKWLITGKMWANSVPSQPPTHPPVRRPILHCTPFLANSALNTPKPGVSGGTSAGVNVVTAVVRLRSTATISFKCSDFGSHANAHTVVLTAIG